MTSEFDLRPGDRVRLYRVLFCMSYDAIRETNWYGSCGRKIMYRVKHTAEANIGLGNDGNVVAYLCDYPPDPHFHLGHKIIHPPTRKNEVAFKPRVKDFFKNNNLTELDDSLLLESVGHDH